MSIQEFSAQEKEYLRQAADLIEEHGICADKFEQGGAYCAVGALGQVIAGEPALIDLHIAPDDEEFRFNRGEIVGLAYKLDSRLLDFYEVTTWNDRLVKILGPDAAKVAVATQLRIWASE